MRRSDPPLYVVDSSVVTKIYLLDDELRDEATSLNERFGRGELLLVLPIIAQYETASAIVAAVRERQISDEWARRALESLFDLGIPVVGDANETRDIILRAYPVARELGCTISQATFLVVSQSIDAPLITADRPFFEQARESFDVLWLADLKLP